MTSSWVGTGVASSRSMSPTQARTESIGCTRHCATGVAMGTRVRPVLTAMVASLLVLYPVVERGAALAAPRTAAAPGTNTAPGTNMAPESGTADALARARQSGRAVPIDSMTTETTAVSADPDGQLTLTQNLLPVR